MSLASPIFRRDRDKDSIAIALAASDMSISDNSPFLAFDDNQYDSTHMIFDFDEGAYDSKPPVSPWDSNQNDFAQSFFPASPASTSSQLDVGSHMLPSDRSFDHSFMAHYSDVPPATPEFSESSLYSTWLTEPDLQSPSAPIDIPLPGSQSPHINNYVAYSDKSSVFPDVSPFSPNTAYAALQPLPRSYSPSPMGDTVMPDALHSDMSVSPSDYHHSPPTWATQLFNNANQSSSAVHTESPSPISVPFPTMGDDAFATQRPRHRRDITSISHMFTSSSAPSTTQTRPPFSRGYSRRAESISEHDDSTIRKKRRSPTVDEDDRRSAEPQRERESPPAKSLLKPPKLAPSAWQLYFTDWIQRHQASGNKKLNVAQAAKEAGQEYAGLTPEQKEPYKRRSLAAKEARERELQAYMRTLTPDDIKRENAFRTAQRKAGKSRKGNIKDPNAPKKPLSAYFMFLQRIRSDPELVKEVFGEETETTKQSVLAAAKWRSMTDDERKPFLAQAEQEKLEYEAARKMYEEGTTGYSSSINFSILPGSTINAIAFPSSLRPLKQEPLSSESESDGFATDDAGDKNKTIRSVRRRS
ncbi:hypothetical protein C8Q75DRAFT_729766 [Abortiporus biennis]|nr:hypothetical protein C8Q75DRAFT_729766 [Abortiporus biennis]